MLPCFTKHFPRPSLAKLCQSMARLKAPGLGVDVSLSQDNIGGSSNQSGSR